MLSCKRLIILAFLCGLLQSCGQGTDPAVSQIEAFIATDSVDKTDTEWKLKLNQPPMLKFSEGKSYFWQLETNLGNISIKLMPDVAPMHVSSTIYLTQLGFYDDLIFHRIIPNFMAQGGCPKGLGIGHPGYQYAGEFSGDVKHDKAGLLSMANAGPNTDGSQFFLTFKATPHLDNFHTIFGEVTQGMDVLKAIEVVGSNSGKPKSPVVIKRAKIIVN